MSEFIEEAKLQSQTIDHCLTSTCWNVNLSLQTHKTLLLFQTPRVNNYNKTLTPLTHSWLRATRRGSLKARQRIFKYQVVCRHLNKPKYLSTFSKASLERSRSIRIKELSTSITFLKNAWRGTTSGHIWLLLPFRVLITCISTHFLLKEAGCLPFRKCNITKAIWKFAFA